MLSVRGLLAWLVLGFLACCRSVLRQRQRSRAPQFDPVPARCAAARAPTHLRC